MVNPKIFIPLKYVIINPATDIFFYQKKQNDELQEKKHQDVLNEFSSKIELCIVYKTNAYLLHKLLKSWQLTCEDRELISNITQILLLEKEIDNRFPESIEFYVSGKYAIVHPQYTNPCEYSVSTLKDFRLRNKDIMKSFAKIIKQSIS